MSEPVKPFPRAFWTANTTELFERAAYYAVASFVVIYLGQMGLGAYWPSTLNGLLWTIIYFLPVLSGTIADQIGFRRALLLAFVTLAIGYFLMGAPVWLMGATMADSIGQEVTASGGVIGAILGGLLLIGIGGSFVKPCIAGTVQKTAGSRATLAFAIFYMVINIGSLVGRFISYIMRTKFDLSYIFAVGAGFAVVSFVLVFILYKEPKAEGPPKERKPVGRILADMVLVLGNLRFTLFLLASTGFFFLYTQVYNVLPLYWKRVLETNPAVDIYTMANPFVIVFFQLLVTKLFGKLKPIFSIVIGIIIVAGSMLINLVPIYLAGGIRAPVFDLLPIASAIGITTVGLIAFGELFTSARTYEYIGAMAPKGQEGLFLGYASLPIALGALSGGPIGAWIFNDVMCAGATTRPDGLLEVVPSANAAGWLILTGVGLASALGMAAYNWWLKRQLAADAAEAAA